MIRDRTQTPPDAGSGATRAGTPGPVRDPAVYFARGCGGCARFDTPGCSALRHAPALVLLRTLCCDAGLTETAKWGQPCYTHAGRNVALIGAVRAGVALSLFEAARIDDPSGLLAPAGPNSRIADTIRLASAVEIQARAADLAALLAQARALAAGGPAPRRPADVPPDLPPDLAADLAADPALAAAFAALTPGRQRAYAIALASARTAADRAATLPRSCPDLAKCGGFCQPRPALNPDPKDARRDGPHPCRHRPRPGGPGGRSGRHADPVRHAG